MVHKLQEKMTYMTRRNSSADRKGFARDRISVSDILEAGLCKSLSILI